MSRDLIELVHEHCINSSLTIWKSVTRQTMEESHGVTKRVQVNRHRESQAKSASAGQA
jgi:hypothetical protein